MSTNTVSVRELRNHGGEVLEKVATSQAPVVVTKDGKPVAELRPLRPRGLSAEELVARRRHLPKMDSDALRRDIDAVLDMSV